MASPSRCKSTPLLLSVLAFISFWTPTGSAAAQGDPHEVWNPDLIICGPLATNVYVQNATPNACVTTPANPLDPSTSLLFPNDFAQNSKTLDLLVSDTSNGRVLLFGADGTPKGQLGGAVSPFSHNNGGTSAGPFGAVADMDGNVLVADPGFNRIFLFDKTGVALPGLPSVSNCTGDPGFSQPWRIALDPGTSIMRVLAHGRVYVVEGDPNDRVSICDAEWNFVTSVGSEGSGRGRFESPTGIALDPAGRIYVADPNNDRVQIFDAVTSATPLSLLHVITPMDDDTPRLGISSITGMKYPYGVAIDANGRVFIADASSNQIWVLDKYVATDPQFHFSLLNVTIGSQSSGNCDVPAPPGQAADLPGVLRCPANITLDSTGRLLVADPLNQRVQRFNHPLMTTTLVNGAASVTPGQPITVTVIVQAAHGQFGKVIPIVTPSNPNLVTQPPTISPDGQPVTIAQACTASDPTVLNVGTPETFTVTFVSTGAQGPLSFTAYATAVDCLNNKLAVSAQDGASTSDRIAVGSSSGSIPPKTTVVVNATLGYNGWYVGTTPTLTFTAKGSPIPNEIDIAFGAQQPPSGTAQVCQGSTTDVNGRYCTVALPQAGSTQVWYRSVNSDGFTEPWINPTTLIPNSLLVRYDHANPLVTPLFSPEPNDAGWNNTNITVSISVLGSDAPLCGPIGSTHAALCAGPLPAPIVDPTPVVVTAESLLTSLPTMTACDIAGRCSSTNPQVQIDKTPPTIASFVIQPTPNGAGWNATNVTVTFTGHDNLSGFAPGMSTFTTGPFTTDGANQTVTVGPHTFMDLAGNWNTDSKTATFSIDKTPPTITAPVIVPPAGVGLNAFGYYNLTGLPNAFITVNVTASDATSGAQKVCYNPTGGTTCSSTAALSGGVYAVTVSSAGVTTGSLWAIDVAGNQSAPQAFTVKITRSAPMAVNQNLLTPVNTVKAGTVTATGGTGTITFALVAGSAVNGTATVAGNGAFTFTPVNNFTGTGSFKFTASDLTAASTGTITITVTNNQPPVCTNASANPGSIWPPNHKFVTVNIKGVTDPDGNPVTFTINKIWQDEPTLGLGDGDTPIDGQILNGSVAQVRAERSGSGNGRVYQIFFTASDGNGGSCIGSVTVGVPHDQSGQAPVDSGVRYDSLVAGGAPVAGTVNHAPVAMADTANVFKGESVNILVLANDMDADGNTLTVTSTTTPAHGAVSINANGSIRYTPASTFTGTDSFTYTISDGHGGLATARVTVTVKAHAKGDGCDNDNHDGHHEHHNDGNDHEWHDDHDGH